MSLRTLPKPVIFAGILLLAAFLGWVDCHTGRTVSIFAFYSIPIIIAVWVLGNRWGFLMCLLTICTVYFARRAMVGLPVGGPRVEQWNNLMRFTTLLLYYFAASGVRTQFSVMNERVSRLTGILPICKCCKRIRDESGYWGELEAYLDEHSEADVERKLCPDCSKRLAAGRSPAFAAARLEKPEEKSPPVSSPS